MSPLQKPLTAPTQIGYHRLSQPIHMWTYWAGGFAMEDGPDPPVSLFPGRTPPDFLYLMFPEIAGVNKGIHRFVSE